ncbi:helix-turn-helix domain-containing protein [Tumebacillus permanentifrigoris]|uniref:Cytoskeletal protein RodZ n=1 Tax=Tumebacillus permanentifrigoris TaxID=378543 RepID=A0A316DCS5_9BACL|nr:RodZ domain-containing protein [Tumebacillus permanentifrigoris]PWK15486.1 cytoskeletal protein RodZ [Tumebacillus permanentifrigoris]
MQELGTELKQAREQQELTLEQVQQDTKIRSRYLEAIEQGDLSVLPGLVYARGFIRSYAEYLGLNGHELLERHGLLAATETVQGDAMRRAGKKPASVDVTKPTLGNSRLLPQLVAGIGVLAILIAAYVLLVRKVDPAPTQDQAQTQATANAQNLTPTAQVTPVPAPVPQPEPPKPQVTVTQSAKEANRTLYAVQGAENLSLVLTAQDNCWVQVTADGKVVESGIIKVGESRTWSATKDIAVLTGKSKFITLKLNEQAVTFEPQLRGYTYEFQKS